LTRVGGLREVNIKYIFVYFSLDMPPLHWEQREGTGVVPQNEFCIYLITCRKGSKLYTGKSINTVDAVKR
jgi:hypothetical protein